MSLVRTILERVTALLPQPRVIMERSESGPYLSRWYLIGRPTMPDGSEPFNETGQTKPGIHTSGRLGVYLHKFHRDDESDELHNHPWKLAVAVVLAGGYIEERRAEVWDPLDDRGARYIVEKRVVRPGTFNIITGDDFHRVDLIEKDSWSLFVTWQREQSWGFWDRHTNKFTPWREYLEEWRAWQLVPFEEKLSRVQKVVDDVLDAYRWPVFPTLDGLFDPHHNRRAVVEAVAKKAAVEHEEFVIVCDETNNTKEDMEAGKIKLDLFVPSHLVQDPEFFVKVDPQILPRGTIPREGEEDAGQGQVEKSDGGKGSEEA